MNDPFDIPEYLIPPGMSFQWFSLHPDDQTELHKPDLTWKPVPWSRMKDHFGKFANLDGTVVVMNCRLFERPKVMSDAYIRQCEEQALELEQEQLELMKGILEEAGCTSFDITIKKSYR